MKFVQSIFSHVEYVNDDDFFFRFFFFCELVPLLRYEGGLLLNKPIALDTLTMQYQVKITNGGLQRPWAISSSLKDWVPVY